LFFIANQTQVETKQTRKYLECSWSD